jgi:hypothetical protein
MERLINNDSMVKQLQNPDTTGNPEDGGNMFSEISVQTRATKHKV